MNAILKFKQGRMIPKAQGGLRFVEAGTTTMGNKVWADATTGDLYEFNQNPNDAKYVNRFKPGMRGHLGKSYNFYNLFSGRGTINGADYVRKSAAPKDYSFMKGGTRLRTADEEARLKDPAIQKYLNRQQSSATQPSAPATVGPKRTPINWGNKFNDFVGGLSEEQQTWLKDNGLNDATKLQDYLTNMGFGVGKFGSDGKFGKDSRAAWDKFAASGIMGKNRDQEILAEKQQPVVDAPDPFGYKTSNTYEGDDFASKMKGMGIRSNADLINFMHNSGKEGWKGDAWQTQFRSDVDKALGGDYSDANIRKVFGTQGKWGRGFMGRGDFGDFQNALQTNAGSWNGAYELKQNDARMDAARQQYAAKQAQQYTAPQLSKLTVEDPSKKFMVGKTQTNTLGNVGAGSLGDDWTKFALQTGYLPTE